MRIEGNAAGELGEKRFRLIHLLALIEERVQLLTSEVKRRGGEGGPKRLAVPHLTIRDTLAETVSKDANLMDGTRDMSKFLKYAAVIALVAGVIVSLPDIKRYIKISSM
jgi:hypothetical protein